MKIKDLPKDANLQDIKVIIPDVVYKHSSLPYYEIENQPVYLMGWMMGDFFVKLKKEDSQIYPMLFGPVPSDIDEWEVADYQPIKEQSDEKG